MKKLAFMFLVFFFVSSSLHAQTQTQMTPLAEAVTLDPQNISILKNNKDKVSQKFSGDQQALAEFYTNFVQKLTKDMEIVFPGENLAENETKTTELYLAYFLLKTAGLNLDSYSTSFFESDVKVAIMVSLFREYMTVTRPKPGSLSFTTSDIPLQRMSYFLSMFYQGSIVKFEASMGAELFAAAKADMNQLLKTFGINQDFIQTILSGGGANTGLEVKTNFHTTTRASTKTALQQALTLSPASISILTSFKDIIEEVYTGNQKVLFDLYLRLLDGLDENTIFVSSDKQLGENQKRLSDLFLAYLLIQNSGRELDEAAQASFEMNFKMVLMASLFTNYANVTKSGDRFSVEVSGVPQATLENTLTILSESSLGKYSNQLDQKTINTARNFLKNFFTSFGFSQNDIENVFKKSVTNKTTVTSDDEGDTRTTENPDSEVTERTTISTTEKDTKRETVITTDKDVESALGDVSLLIGNRPKPRKETIFTPTFNLTYDTAGLAEIIQNNNYQTLAEYSLADEFLKALKDNEDYQAFQTGENDVVLLPSLMEAIRFYASEASIIGEDEAGETFNAVVTVIDNAQRNAPETYGKSIMTWVVAGIPVSEENNTPTIESAARRCATKIAETESYKNGKKLKDEEDNQVYLDLGFKLPAKKYTVYSETRKDIDESKSEKDQVKEKVFCGAITTRDKNKPLETDLRQILELDTDVISEVSR